MFIQPDKTIANIDYAPGELDGWVATGELADKITKHYPNFDFVVEDGELVDVTLTEVAQDGEL